MERSLFVGGVDGLAPMLVGGSERASYETEEEEEEESKEEPE